MKTLKKTNYVLILLSVLFFANCSKEKIDNPPDGHSSLTEKETYSIEISGVHPTIGAIDSKIEILKNLNIGGNQITLKAREGVGSHDLTIIIHLNKNQTPSGKEESIGMYLFNNNETDIWNVSADYQMTNSPSIATRGSLDYVLKDNGFYNDTRNISDKVSITVEGNRLKGTFNRVSTKFDGTNDGVKISGSFDADLSRLNQ